VGLVLFWQIIPIKCKQCNVLILKTPTCFGPHWPIIRKCTFTWTHTNL